MKTLTLFYDQNEDSQAALNEIKYIQNKYSNIIIKNNIQFITKTNAEHKKIDPTIDIYPTLFFIEDFKIEKIEGYNLENLNKNYSEYFLDIFKLRDQQPFPSWIGNEETFSWQSPFPKPDNEKEGSGDPVHQNGVETEIYIKKPFPSSVLNSKKVGVPPVDFPEYGQYTGGDEENKTFIHNKQFNSGVGDELSNKGIAPFPKPNDGQDYAGSEGDQKGSLILREKRNNEN